MFEVSSILREKRMHILGIDIGGTGIKYGIVDIETGELLGEKARIPTPRPATPTAVGDVLAQIVALTRWQGPIGIGFPAAVVNGTVCTAANIDKSFLGLKIVDYFAERTGCPVCVANDADAAGLAEMRFGAGRGLTGSVLIVTVGTGIGTALFYDGRLMPNTELGHIYLDNGKEAEPYASEATRVTKGLKWKDWGPRLGEVLRALEHLLWPELIILGGGVSRKLAKYAPYLETRAPVVAASFLNQAGIVGAALLAEKMPPAAAEPVTPKRKGSA